MPGVAQALIEGTRLHRRRLLVAIFAAVPAAALLVGASPTPPRDASAARPSPPAWLQPQLARAGLTGARNASPGGFVETGDLPALAARGRLRVVTRERHEVRAAPRRAVERALVEQFARDHGLAPVWLRVGSREELGRAVAEGRGDVAIDALPLQQELRADLARTTPLRAVRYAAITRRDAGITAVHALAGRRVAVRASSPILGLLERLAAAEPGLDLRPQPEYRDERKLLAAVQAGQIDALVGSREEYEPLLTEYPGLAFAFDLTDDRPIAWTTRATATELRAALDEHLHRHELVRREKPAYRADLPGLGSRGVLRVITRRDNDNFFLDGGRPAGFEHDLAARFAARHGLKLDIVVADGADDMLRLLEEGYGDLIIARSAVRAAMADPHVGVSRAYYHIAPTVVTRAADRRYARREDLRRARLLVHPALTDRRVLESLAADGLLPAVEYAPAEAPVEDVLDAVAAGEYDATVIDSHRLRPLLEDRADLAAGPSIDGLHQFRWAMRVEDRALAAAVDEFLGSAFRSAWFNILRHRYFREPLAGEARLAAADGGRVSPYDAMVHRYAEEYGFDWRLLVAQMFEESRFDPRATSDAGAVGLMQVLPPTAQDVGFSGGSLTDPAIAVHAGIKYLHMLRERFEDHLPLAERTWFALAAYHAGYDRVRRARRHATRLGLDPDRWFDNVERAMRSMSASPQDRHLLRTVAYVRRIRDRYEAYLELGVPVRLAGTPATRDGSV